MQKSLLSLVCAIQVLSLSMSYFVGNTFGQSQGIPNSPSKTTSDNENNIVSVSAS